jgi:ABC-type transport system substrate-binding protein
MNEGEAMDWSDKPALPALSTIRTIGGIRRGVMTAALTGLLLVGAGVAAVSAASPDPSASTTPSTQAEPSDDGTTTPTESARPDRLCPDKAQDTESDASTG